jgi:hypothetical protein
MKKTILFLLTMGILTAGEFKSSEFVKLTPAQQTAYVAASTFDSPEARVYWTAQAQINNDADKETVFAQNAEAFAAFDFSRKVKFLLMCGKNAEAEALIKNCPEKSSANEVLVACMDFRKANLTQPKKLEFISDFLLNNLYKFNWNSVNTARVKTVFKYCIQFKRYTPDQVKEFYQNLLKVIEVKEETAELVGYFRSQLNKF